jgi:hypothetical protein
VEEHPKKFFTAKAKQREADAAASVAEKLRILDRLKERNEQIKRARPIGSGRGQADGEP